jgi:hypothetical protein
MVTTQASRRNRKTHAASLPRSAPLASSATIGDLLKRLGHIPAERVRLRPTPGTATEKDVLDVLNRENVPCELVEGTLVEKAMGYEELEIAGLLLTFGAGVRVVWLVDPRKRTVRVHTAVDQFVLIKEGQTLDGGAVLPGFVLRMDELFVSDEP